MRLKTFTATYLLLLAVLFTSLSIISVYLNNSQTNMLRGQSERDFHRISATLARDIAVSYSRIERLPALDFQRAVETLVSGYARYYRGHGIEIELLDRLAERQEGELPTFGEISFIQRNGEHFVHIAGTLPEPFEFYQLNYHLDITESIVNMRNIQHILLIFFIAFSVAAALVLYFILLKIFKPLDIIARTSRKIADEHFHERIYIKGNNELVKVAGDFNRMAEKIENQIRMLEEENAGKQRFIDNFAHEIRTPLTSIYGNAEYMQKAILEEGELVKSTELIMDKAKQMTDIANSLLKLATLRNYTPVETEINLPRLFEEIAQTLNSPLLTHQSCDAVLMGQEDLIKSLLVNLCLNGLKSGASSVALKAERQAESLVLSVTDNGAGIPAESLQKVTEPFYRVDKARNRNHGGAGLGLTLCKQIADVHGAEMEIESKVGEGTTVRVIFLNKG